MINTQTTAGWGKVGPFVLPEEAIGEVVRIEGLFTGPTESSGFLGAYIDDLGKNCRKPINRFRDSGIGFKEMDLFHSQTNQRSPENRTMKHARLLCLAACAVAIPAANASTVIFSNNFTGSGGLNGTTTGGETWVASTQFSASGSFTAGGTSNGSSATLAYTPSSGFIYMLDARVDVGSTGWIGLGFADGQSNLIGSMRRFTNGSTPLGRVWMLHLDGAAGRASQEGTTQHETWTAVTDVTGSIDMRIVLDTQSAVWTATWYAKDANDTTFTQVWQTEDVVNQANINSVGFAVPGTNATGTISSFSLTQIPEPATAFVGGLGLLALLRRRRA